MDHSFDIKPGMELKVGWTPLFEPPIPTHCLPINTSMESQIQIKQEDCTPGSEENVSCDPHSSTSSSSIGSSEEMEEMLDMDVCMNDKNNTTTHVHDGDLVEHYKQEPPEADKNGIDAYSTAQKSSLYDEQNKEESFDCRVCSEGFSSSILLVKHITMQNHLRSRVNSVKNVLISHNPVEKLLDKYECQLCIKKYSSITALKNHMRKHVVNEKRTGYTCTMCGQNFADRGSLFVHNKTHDEEKRYTCSICAKKFSQIGHLQQHELRHSGEKPYSCSICDRVFADLSSKNHHIKFKHKEVRNYKCSICSKEFMNSSHLKRHLLVHSREKPYVCSLCDKAFADNYYLQVHIRKHSGNNPYCCSVCNKPFYVSVSLRRHMLSAHSKGADEALKCEFCSKFFVTKYNLKRHVKTHTGERPYICHVCSKSYVEKHDLERHMSNHSS